ncbi:MBL fold metallo-hydrolase [Paradesulfitobacterium aromaticivorans]
MFLLITDGIHLIDKVKGSHSFLVTDPKPFVVDTGLPGQEQVILNYLKQTGIKPGELNGIILTHFDVDHVGSAVALQQLTGCPLYAHELEIPYISGLSLRPGVKRWLPLLVRPIYGKLANPLKIEPVRDNDTFLDWEIIHTPGHTPGHIVLYRNGVGIVGDLLQGGDIRLAPALFTWNASNLDKSVQKLLGRPLRWILPGHGPATAASGHWLDHFKRT